MTEKQNLQIAFNGDNFKVVFVKHEDSEKIKDIKVADNNLEFITDKSFATVALAARWAEENYRGLV